MSFRLLLMYIIVRIAESETDCKPSVSGGGYRGNLSQTRGGYTCQKWSEQVPNSHTMGSLLPGGSVVNVNYCRNPDRWNHQEGPWCYTTTGPSWDYCNLPLCSNPQPVASWIFEDVYGGTDTSTAGENHITMINLTHGSGINRELNGSIVLPTNPSQLLAVENPTTALRFRASLSFITYVYMIGNTGPIMEYNDFNGENIYRLKLYVGPDSTTLTTLFFKSIYTNYYHASNVLGQGWLKIGLSITENEVKTYVNGQYVHHAPRVGSIRHLGRYTSDGIIFFGSVPANNEGRVGRMACAKFFDFALSDEQMASEECKTNACREIQNGRCVGSCYGFYIGESCDIYLYLYLVLGSSISTKLINTSAIEFSWKLSRVPEPEARQFYHFIVRHSKKDLFDYTPSPEIHIGDDVTVSHVYTYTIENLDHDEEYIISLQTQREFAGSKDYVDSERFTVKVPCAAPETPKGLFVTIQNETFVVSWTTNLYELNSGCSSNKLYKVYIYHKFTLSEDWTMHRVNLSWHYYSFPTEGHSDCFVKMRVVNNAEIGSDTVLNKLNNVTLPPPRPSEDEQSTTPIQTVDGDGNLGKQTQSGLPQTTLILAMCLAVVGVVMIAGISVATVCWKKTNSALQNLKHKTIQIEKLKANQSDNCKTEYLEPVSSSDDVYQEIGSPNRTREARQYESLDIELDI